MAGGRPGGIAEGMFGPMPGCIIAFGGIPGGISGRFGFTGIYWLSLRSIWGREL